MSSSSAARTPVGASWDQRNARRQDLIDKKLRGRLSPTEEAELRDLQKEAETHIQLPPIEPLLELRRQAVDQGFLPDRNDEGR